MKNYELLNIYKGLEKVTNLETSIPVSEGFKVVKNRILIESELKSFEDMKNAIIKKYAGEEGKVKTDNPNYKKCVDELNELANQECEEITFKKIKLSAIEKIDIPMNAISALAFMIDDTEENV